MPKAHMTDVLTQDLVSYDPLSEVTRKERRALLGLSLLGVALVKVPLIPEKFTKSGSDTDFRDLRQASGGKESAKGRLSKLGSAADFPPARQSGCPARSTTP
jgi:hypothetical protein